MLVVVVLVVVAIIIIVVVGGVPRGRGWRCSHPLQILAFGEILLKVKVLAEILQSS